MSPRPISSQIIYDEVVEVLVLSTFGPDIISVLLCLAYFFIHFMLF